MPADSVGATLRAARRRRGLSLAELAARSEDVVKPSTLGSYERGDRTISVLKLGLLAELYGVTLEVLLERSPHVHIDLVSPAAPARGGIVLDLSRFVASGEHAAGVVKFATAIKAMRRDPTPSVLVVRRSDAGFIASLVGCAPVDVDRELQSALETRL